MKSYIEFTDIKPLIDLFKSNPDNLVGGNLHIFLSDGNIDDEFVKHCLDNCLATDDKLGESICRLSLKMSKTQRKRMYEHF